MNPYKHWSGAFRKKSLYLTNKAKALGWLLQPSVCAKCDSKVGIHFHNEDYDVTYYTLKEVFGRKPIVIAENELSAIKHVLLPVCRKCHAKIHKLERADASIMGLP